MAASVHCGLQAQEGKVLKGVGGPQHAQQPESQAGSCVASQASSHMWRLHGAGAARCEVPGASRAAWPLRGGQGPGQQLGGMQDGAEK